MPWQTTSIKQLAHKCCYRAAGNPAALFTVIHCHNFHDEASEYKEDKTMLSKYKVLYSLKVQKQTKSVVDAIREIESSDKEEYTDDEVAAIHKKVLGLDYDHAPAYGLRSKEDNELLRELEKDRLRDGYDFYSDQEADIWN